jgi:hypothetical protein
LYNTVQRTKCLFHFVHTRSTGHSLNRKDGFFNLGSVAQILTLSRRWGRSVCDAWNTTVAFSAAKLTVAFSSIGVLTDLRDLCNDLVGEHQAAVIVGGFAHGHLSKKTSRIVDKTVAICDEPLDAWVVASRIVYEYEYQLAL